ncbi:TetR/AcrR family transcriptional regulator [Enterococcus sp. LJL99]
MKNNKTKEPFNKKHVIDVASRLFFVKGYSYTSMDEVTRISGVSKSNIYYHFKSKDELLVAVIEYWSNHYQELILESVGNKSQSVEERIITFLSAISQEIIGREFKGSCPFITLYIQSPMKPNTAKKKITTFFQQLQPVFVELFQQGAASGEFRSTLNCTSTGSLFLSTMEGAILLSETLQDTTLLITTAKDFCEMLY